MFRSCVFIARAMPAKNFEQKIDSLEKKWKEKKEKNGIRFEAVQKEANQQLIHASLFTFFVFFEGLDALSKFILLPLVYIGWTC